MLHGHVLEVGELHPRPDHEVLGQAGHVGLAEAVFDGRAFEIGHAGEEESHVYGCEEKLVAGYAGDDGAVGRGRVYVFCEDAIPFCGGGAEDYCSA